MIQPLVTAFQILVFARSFSLQAILVDYNMAAQLLSRPFFVAQIVQVITLIKAKVRQVLKMARLASIDEAVRRTVSTVLTR